MSAAKSWVADFGAASHLASARRAGSRLRKSEGICPEAESAPGGTHRVGRGVNGSQRACHVHASRAGSRDRKAPPPLSHSRHTSRATRASAAVNCSSPARLPTAVGHSPDSVWPGRHSCRSDRYYYARVSHICESECKGHSATSAQRHTGTRGRQPLLTCLLCSLVEVIIAY